MKKLFIVANWKSNQTENEVRAWFDRIKLKDYSPQADSDKEIIICPSFIHLPLVKNMLEKHNLPFKIGAQDISQFSKGPYTGEINGTQIREFAQYVLIGHSERRKYLQETNEVVERKNKQANYSQLESIVCIQNEETMIPEGCNFVAYEPPNAISTSGPGARADNPLKMNEIAKKIKEKKEGLIFLYGGSVDASNIQSFTKQEYIDGVLIGSASLDAQSFLEGIKNA